MGGGFGGEVPGFGPLRTPPLLKFGPGQASGGLPLPHTVRPMSDTTGRKTGHPVWFDLTVPDAEPIRDFYSGVLAWRPEPVEMGGYSDFSMIAPDGTGVAGVCHARGTNADLPAAWMVYFLVDDLQASLQTVVARGGEVLKDPSTAGPGRYAVIRDPAGAVCALYEADAAEGVVDGSEM